VFIKLLTKNYHRGQKKSITRKNPPYLVGFVSVFDREADSFISYNHMY